MVHSLLSDDVVQFESQSTITEVKSDLNFSQTFSNEKFFFSPSPKTEIAKEGASSRNEM